MFRKIVEKFLPVTEIDKMKSSKDELAVVSPSHGDVNEMLSTDIELANRNGAKKIKRPEVYLTELRFNDGSSVKINSNDIVVFVGANNVGKSQSLCDIYELCGSHPDPVVVNAVSCTKTQKNDVLLWCRQHLNVEKGKSGDTFFGLDVSHAFEYDFDKTLAESSLSSMREVFVCKLNTSDRLSISLPKETISRNAIPKYPIHILIRDGKLRKKISNAFFDAFGKSLFPFVGNGTSLSLCVGVEPSMSQIKTNSLIEFYAEYIEIADSIPKLHEQGDGMRSFAGLMLYLVLDRYNIFLIDEPEAFLHPPQATILGGIISDLLGEDRQAIVATHSIHFIKGLLERCSNRVKIVRIDRKGNTNSFSLLDNDSLEEIGKDPFLNHSSLLEGMFYKNVVLCEGDVDCMFYSMLNNADDMKGVKGTETLFTHCGGKQRMPKVIGALKELRVDVKVIPDFDVLNNEVVLKELVQVCGGDWSRIERDYKILIADINQRSNVGRTGADVLKEISAELADVMKTVVSQTKMRNIRKSLESNTIWDRLKTMGVIGVGAGNPRSACDSILKYLSTIGIHVVPCGELECFVRTVGGHGPDWLHAVIEQCPDTVNNIYDQAKTFIRSWNL